MFELLIHGDILAPLHIISPVCRRPKDKERILIRNVKAIKRQSYFLLRKKHIFVMKVIKAKSGHIGQINQCKRNNPLLYPLKVSENQW